VKVIVVRRRKLQPFPIVFLIVIAMAVASVPVGIWAFRAGGRQRVEEAREQLRREGFITSETDYLQNYYGVERPEAENGALLLKDAIAAMDIDRDEARFLQRLADPDEDGAGEVAAQILAKNEEALRLMKAGAAMPYLRFPLDLSRRSSPAHVERLRVGGDLLRHHAFWRARSGDPEASLEAIRTLYRLAFLLREEPNTWSQVLVVNLHAQAVNSLESFLTEVSLSAEQLEELQEQSRRIESAFSAETLLQTEVFLAYAEIRSSLGDDGWLAEVYQRSGWYLYDVSFHLRELAALRRAAGDPREMARRSANYRTGPFGVLAPRELLFLHDILKAQVTGVARSRVWTSLLGCERFRLRYGRVPNDLGELVPQYLQAIPSDPLTGEALSMQVGGDQLTIESVGTTSRRRAINGSIPFRRE